MGTKELKRQKTGYSYRLRLASIGLIPVLKLLFPGKIVKTDRLKHIGKENKGKGMLILANHLSPTDFSFFVRAFLDTKFTFVVAENMKCFSKFYARALLAFKVIFKKQYVADLSTIKNIKRSIKNGVSVLVCPEGKVSIDGTTSTIMPSIAKLVKWLDCPVATCLVKGSWLQNPKWANGIRRIKGECFADILFDGVEQKDLDIAEIQSRIETALAHNEHKFQQEHGIKIRNKKRAEGLHKLLFKCPICGAEFKMETSGKTLMCANCGEIWIYESNGMLVGGQKSFRIDQWYDFERQAIATEIRDENFEMQFDAEFWMGDTTQHTYNKIADGVVGLNAKRFWFAGEEIQKEVPLEQMNGLAILTGDRIEMHIDDQICRFTFTKEKASTKFLIAVEEFLKIN